MTYAEAKKGGYKDSYTAYARGYVSRKVNIDDQPVLMTKRGKYYVELPNWNSTQYLIRQYIEK